MCVITYKASSRRTRQFMGEVPWPDSRVQIRQTSKQVVVQRCGLTSDRSKTVCTSPPRQGQYLWIKHYASRIRLQERSRICDTEDARAFALQSANFLSLPRRASPRTALEAVNQVKTLTVRKVLLHRESVPLAMHGCMASTGIQQHPFRPRSYTVPHFSCASAHIGPFEDSGTLDRSTADERRQLWT